MYTSYVYMLCIHIMYTLSVYILILHVLCICYTCIYIYRDLCHCRISHQQTHSPHVGQKNRNWGPSVHQFSKTSTAIEQFKPQYSSPGPVTVTAPTWQDFHWEFNGEPETLWDLCLRIMITMMYPLVNVNIAIENHHF